MAYRPIVHACVSCSAPGFADPEPGAGRRPRSKLTAQNNKAAMHCSIVDEPIDNKKPQPEGGGAKVGASLCPQGASIFGPNALRESIVNVFALACSGLSIQR